MCGMRPLREVLVRRLETPHIRLPGDRPGACKKGEPMNSLFRNREFWIGTIFVLVAAVAIQQSLTYGMGLLSSMGPGFFPVVLGSVLLVIGAIALARSLLKRKPENAVQPISIRALGMVSVAIFVTGWTLTHLGSLIALPILVVLSALGGRDVRWTPAYLAYVVCLVLVANLLFIYVLRLPIPLLGVMFD